MLRYNGRMENDLLQEQHSRVTRDTQALATKPRTRSGVGAYVFLSCVFSSDDQKHDEMRHHEKLAIGNFAGKTASREKVSEKLNKLTVLK